MILPGRYDRAKRPSLIDGPTGATYSAPTGPIGANPNAQIYNQ